MRRDVCSASLVSIGTTVIKQETHKCEASEADNQVKILFDKCIKRAKTEETPLRSIYEDAVKEFNSYDFDSDTEMSNYENVRKTLYRHRSRHK